MGMRRGMGFSIGKGIGKRGGDKGAYIRLRTLWPWWFRGILGFSRYCRYIARLRDTVRELSGRGAIVFVVVLGATFSKLLVVSWPVVWPNVVRPVVV